MAGLPEALLESPDSTIAAVSWGATLLAGATGTLFLSLVAMAGYVAKILKSKAETDAAFAAALVDIAKQVERSNDLEAARQNARRGD